MAIISASTMIRSLSLFHITLAALLLRDPSVIANQGIVFILGESMQLPTPRQFLKPSAATAFLAVLFAFIGLIDITALSHSEEFFIEYWGTQAPVRLLFLFVLTGYTYITKPGGMFAERNREYMMKAGDGLNNSLVFTWGFLELVAWFWVFVALREERREKARKIVDERKAEANRL